MTDSVKTTRGKVVCVGDLLVDVWWHVDTAARNIEHAAMAITSDPEDKQIKPGGVGIVAESLRQAGFFPVVFATSDMRPDTYSVIRQLTYVSGVGCHVCPVESFFTPVKTRYINSNGHILVRHDSEITFDRSFNSYHIQNLEEEIRSTGYRNFDSNCIVVSDYNKGCIPWEVRDQLVSVALSRGVPVYVDAKPAHLEKYAGASVFKINMQEFKSFAANDCATHSLEVAITKTAVKLHTPLLIVTDGSSGVYYCHNYETTNFIPTPVKYAAGNCVGAGDMFLAGLVLGFSEIGDYNPVNLNTTDVFHVLKFAIVAAGQRIRANGNKPLNQKKILDEVYRRNTPVRRLMSVDAFIRFAQKHRNAGKEVIFTNGCFDILHDGHIELLTAAKREGDILVVAVDADENVRRLKGSARPVQPENIRAGNIAALDVVDAVCVFADFSTNQTLRRLIEQIKPAVLVKGADYADKEVVGADIIENQDLPGRVVLVPLVPNSSTTAFVNKIKAMTP